MKNPHGEMTGKHIYVIIASCFMAWGVMGMMNAYGVFLTPMQEFLQVGKAAATLHMSLKTMATGLASPLAALLLAKKISVKKTMPAGMVIYLVCSAFVPYTRSVILVDILSAIAGFSLAFFSFMMITILLGNWFRKSLGTFSGIVISFSGIGSAIMSPVTTRALALLGYQTTYLLYSVLTILMVVPVLFCTHTPEESGLLPYGAGAADASGDQKEKPQSANLDIRFRLISAVSIVLFLMTVLLMGLTTLNSHLPSLAVSRNFTADVGALLLSASMIGNLSFKFVLGVIIDRLGVLKGFVIVLLISLAGLVIILFTENAAALMLIGSFLYGTVFSLASLGLSILTRYLYGNEQYNSVYSKVTLFTSVGSAIFVFVVGWLYDLTGSYRAPLLMGIVMVAASLIMTLYLAVKRRT
ncbi:MAG: MFS transporter [Lachnospiraceae bacterium]|nr:MFS transporter [Lachnospiraceae bacterium]